MAATILILAVFIFGNVLALPTNSSANERLYKEEHCIKMTPKKEAEIQLIIEKIGDFLNDLSAQYDNYDIRLVKFDIEQHTDDEVDEKDTVLQVTVNDCAVIEEEEDDKTEEKTKDEKTNEEEKKDEKTKEETEVSQQVPEDNEVIAKIPEVTSLVLEEQGQKLLKAIEKRNGNTNPILVYIQEFFGKKEFIFPY